MAATWTNITNAALEPGKPIRSVDGLALRDNPIAITEGAAGAPKIQAAALDTTTSERDWVLARTAQANVGVVGTYAFLRGKSGLSGVNETYNQGETFPGSYAQYWGIEGDFSSGVLFGAPAGTWRVMGGQLTVKALAGDDNTFGTLCLRIA